MKKTTITHFFIEIDIWNANKLKTVNKLIKFVLFKFIENL